MSADHRERVASRRPLLLASAALSLLLAVALWAYLRLVGDVPGDLGLFERAQRYRGGAYGSELSNFWGVIGTAPVAAMTVGVAAILVGRTMGGWAAGFVLIASLGVLGGLGVRELLGPTPLSPSPLSGESYPSGHVIYATCLFGALAILARRAGRADAAVVLVALFVIMGPTRVVVGAHLPSDVIGGYAFAAFWLLTVFAMLGPRLAPAKG